MSIKIAITNEKGGCGKTTSAVNISAILAERGYRVLLADVDPQSYATMYYGLYNADDPSLYDAITGVWPVNAAIVKTDFSVDVLRSNTKSMRLEEMLTEYKLRGRAYNDLLSKLLTPIENNYDYIIIDCPPQGYKLLENVQRYADYILIPMIPDEFALHSLRIKAESLIEIRRTINPHLRLLGGLIIMDEKNGTKAIYRDALQSQDVIPFFSATVRKNITLSRAINAHEPINTYEWIDEDTGIIRYQSNGFRDVGADGMFRSAVIFGEISSIPDTPGLAVCMNGHIGIYIGNGEVIEAKSNHDGVVKTQLSEGSWTYWMQLPGITYLTGGTHPYGTKKVTLENGRIKEISAGIVAGKGEFEWPLPAPYGKDYITSGSGSRYNPVTGMYENSHGAIDIGAPAMTPIYAAADGTVVMSTWHDSYGNFVKIDHGNGWSTLYAHQTKHVAKVGESVSAGDLIGYVGSTGDSTGNHLHFEIRYNDNRLDPLQFFE